MVVVSLHSCVLFAPTAAILQTPQLVCGFLIFIPGVAPLSGLNASCCCVILLSVETSSNIVECDGTLPPLLRMISQWFALTHDQIMSDGLTRVVI